MLTSNQPDQMTSALYRRHVVPMQNKLRALGVAVEFHPGTAHAILTSALESGAAVEVPTDDAVRPGRGLGLAVGMIVDELTPAESRQTTVSIDHLRLQARDQAPALGVIPGHNSILKRPSIA